MTVADLIRANAPCDLSHIDDVELGARLVAMPLDVADDPERAALWLVYGLVPGQLVRRGRYSNKEG